MLRGGGAAAAAPLAKSGGMEHGRLQRALVQRLGRSAAARLGGAAGGPALGADDARVARRRAGAPAGDVNNGLQQFFDSHVLLEVDRGPGADPVDQVLPVAARLQHDQTCGRQERAEAVEQFAAQDAFDVRMGQEHVRRAARQPPEQVLHGARRDGPVDLAAAFQPRRHRLAEQPRIAEDGYGDLREFAAVHGVSCVRGSVGAVRSSESVLTHAGGRWLWTFSTTKARLSELPPNRPSAIDRMDRKNYSGIDPHG